MNNQQAIIKKDEHAIVPNAQNLRMIAKDLLESGMFPGVKSIAGAVTIIEYGREIGIPPVAALQTMSIIKGRLSIESKALLALFHNTGGKTDILKKDATGAQVKFSKAGMKAFTDSFTIEDAQAKGFLSKDNWKLYPEEMCYWRCIAKGIRAFDPGVALGFYTTEEMRDVVPENDFNETQAKQTTNDFPGVEGVSPYDEGEIPNGLKAEGVEHAKEVTGGEEEIIDAEPEPEKEESPATMKEPPEEEELPFEEKPKPKPKPKVNHVNDKVTKALAQQIYKELSMMGVTAAKDLEGFLDWLMEYQITKKKRYAERDDNGQVHVSYGLLSDIEALHSQLSNAVDMWRKTEKK